MRRRAVLLLAAALAAGCGSSEEPKPKTEAPPAEPVSGQTAFWKMFMAARNWSPDVQGLTMRTLPVEGYKVENGKAPAWEATFVSPAKAQARTFTYSIVEAGPLLHKDVFAGLAESWTGPTGQARPWPIQALKVDSVAAWETAAGKSADYMKANPNKPISILLEQTPRHPEVAWRVLWGESVAASNYSIYVGASTGKYLERMR